MRRNCCDYTDIALRMQICIGTYTYMVTMWVYFPLSLLLSFFLFSQFSFLFSLFLFFFTLISPTYIHLSYSPFPVHSIDICVSLAHLFLYRILYMWSILYKIALCKIQSGKYLKGTLQNFTILKWIVTKGWKLFLYV